MRRGHYYDEHSFPIPTCGQLSFTLYAIEQCERRQGDRRSIHHRLTCNEVYSRKGYRNHSQNNPCCNGVHVGCFVTGSTVLFSLIRIGRKKEIIKS